MQQDTFKNLAQHYDAMMDHIDYERWVVVTTMIAELCPDEGFKHLDVACGTGSLIQELTQHRWTTVGVDLSNAMLQEATKSSEEIVCAQANMCHLPFHHSFALATCFFDSLNFLTEDGDLAKALSSIHDSLNDTGVLFFDVITERMVTEHFADKDWIDTNGGHKTRWSGQYDAATRIVTNTIHIGQGQSTAVQERVYTQDEIEAALKSAGFTLLGVLDTETWCAPAPNSLRLDYVVTRNTDHVIPLKFESIQADIQALLAE
jgi:ubiquinone/menaquinone biosynthesis C-methylase UbiE